jgi:hypothetical protein
MNQREWKGELASRLAAHVPAGYDDSAEPANEPTALVGLALLANGRIEAAQQAADWLAKCQARDGSLGVLLRQQTPCWPTAWAMLLWQSLARDTTGDRYRKPLEQAVQWSLAAGGKPAPRKAQFGHDSTLVGWSWAANTHSWLEPTAMFVIALKSAGYADHARTREGVRLIVDRQLPAGGCNYGNTIVLGQELLPHVQPTGLAMIALAGEEIIDPRIERSLEYLQRELSANTATASLCYGLLGLAAHGRAPAAREAWLQRAYARVGAQGGSPYKLALVALAAAERSALGGK